ncbi:unnamed protein product [Eruca vesicaria subsp. sativa]|uniref:RRM domain-containing protein n=1 Tax=Eruca vesicaria subsp. sativa TaxID=29727 RepID=A0ABC8JQR9_ERUVS|nr:unnamed protein product [Eruca vesicaria subsp. sativa]
MASVRSTFEGFESEAARDEILDKYGSKPRAIISVEGYDTCLPEDDIKTELINHFNSCGQVFNVILRKDPDSPNLDRRALVILFGDGAEEKALELNGTDIGGWNALVKVEPEEEEDEEVERFESSLADELLNDRRFWFGVTVGGYNTCLPADEVKSDLVKLFSSCGEITHVYVCTLDKMTNIYFHEEEGEAKTRIIAVSHYLCRRELRKPNTDRNQPILHHRSSTTDPPLTILRLLRDSRSRLLIFSVTCNLEGSYKQKAIYTVSKLSMAMAFQIIASSPTITKSHLTSSPHLQSSYKASKPYLYSCFSLLGSSCFSPYIGLKHMGISISPKSSNPEKKRRCSKGMVIRASLFGVRAPEALVIGVVALLVFGLKLFR